MTFPSHKNVYEIESKCGIYTMFCEGKGFASK